MRVTGLFALALAAGSGGLAQPADDVWDRESWAEATLLLAPGADSKSDGGGEAALYELALGGSAEQILQSGLRVGIRGTFRVQRDHPQRPGFSGQLPVGPSVGPGGAFSGLAPGPGLAETGARGSLETAFAYIEGGYGELSLGRDIGVAARFHEGDVGVLRAGGPDNPYLDPTGLAGVRTRPDLTGPAVKLSYVTPRLIGIQAGASFTPTADVRGLDRDPVGARGLSLPGLDNAFEVGLNASRRFRSNGLRVRAGLSWSMAEIAPPPHFAALYSDRVETVAGGLEIEFDELRLGVNGLASSEGLVGRDYSAWSAGLARRFGAWDVSMTYGRSDIDALDSDGHAFALAVGRALGDHMDVTLAWQDVAIDPERFALEQADSSAEGVVVEITLRFEN